MRKNYPNLSVGQLDRSIVLEALIQRMFGGTLLFLIFYLCATTTISAQCNTDTPIPFISSTYGGLSASSNINGVCVLCAAPNASRLIDADLNNFATAITTLGAAGSTSYSVRDTDSSYSAGKYVGYRIDTGGLLSVNLLGSITIRTYLNHVPMETVSGASLLGVGLLNGSGNNYVVGFNTTQSFDEIEIFVGGLATLLNTLDVYYPVIRDYCEGPALSCNTVSTMNLPTYPVSLEPSHTGLSFGSIGNVLDAANVISTNTNDYATIALTSGSAGISVKDQFKDYPAGTYAGFEIENPSLLNVSALGNITITTYLNGTKQQELFGNNLVVSGSLLNTPGRYKIGFVPTTSFDEVQISINQVLNLGSTRVYSAVFENFCAGPDLVCNTQTAMVAPTYPVYINGVNTGIDGLVCALCSINNTENLIDQNASNFAQINLTASVGNSGSISVKNQVTDYPIGTFAGFTIENPSLLNVNALDAVTIRTYLDGVLQEIKFGNAALATVGTGLLVGSSLQTIGFITTKAFDEARITITNTATVSLGVVNVYHAVFQKLCPVILECNKTYALTNPTFPVIIDSGKTGVDGVACVACAVNNTNNVLTSSTTDFATILVTAGVIAPASIAVLDHLSIYPVGTFAGFTIKDLNSLLQLDLFNSLTISTYLDGALRESKSASLLLNLSLTLSPFGTGPGVYNVGFKTTQTFDEIRISVGSLASVINDINVYGAFVNTASASGGTLFCAIIDAVDDTFAPIVGSAGNTNAGNVLTNDTINGNPVAINDINLTVSSPAEPLTVGAPVPSIDPLTGIVSVPVGTPAGSYSITYQICYKLNSLTCDSATVTVVVSAAVIDAVPDTISAINGLTGNTNAGNVLTNDTLNGSAITISNVNLTISSPATSIAGGPVPSVDTTTGIISIPAATPAGNYTIIYQICEKLNPGNCDTATVTVTVTAPVILANEDAATVNGTTGGTPALNVLTNDTLNGNPINLSEVTLTSTPNGPLTVNADGSITVAPNTPAGPYTVTYQICEKLNPSNCDTATVTVAVTAPAILANDDTASVNGTTGGTPALNVLTNDTLNGNPVNLSEVNLTSTPNGSLTVNANGSITVVPNTPAGTYTVTYQICEKLNPSNCDTATVTVTVTAPAILANDDTASVNGYTGGTLAVNVLTNDTLNGNPVTLSEVTLTSTPSGPLTVNTDGTITVASNTPAGTYTVTYQICEKLNPSNCDTATVTVTVTATAILANDDAGETVGTVTGGTAFENVLGNDILNGLVVNASQVNISFVSATNPGITLSGTDVVVAAGTPIGNYTLTYQICEILNPTNCDQAVVSVIVASTGPTILANNDIGTPVNGFLGGTAFTNVLVNDILNAAPATTSNVDISFVSSTDSRITLVGTDVIVAAGTPAGTYSLDYQICEKTVTGNCDVARVTITVVPAAILANDDAGANIDGHLGGTAFANVLGNDTLNGTTVTASQVNTTLVSSTNSGITLLGTDVIVLAGTPAGSYSLIYQICEKLNPSNCNTATVTVTVTASVILANDDSTSVNGDTGGIAPVNVLTNDTLNGIAVNPSEVTLTSTPNGPLTINAGGSITVAPNTPAGPYTVTYQICENLNSLNCNTATVTVTVTAPVVLANDDTTSINGDTGGIAPVNVLTNDTLNGTPVNPTEVTLTSTPNGPLTVNTDGSITVAPNTPAGPYTVTYQICENLNPSNCDTATVTVTVTAPVVLANDDTTSINGDTGGIAAVNVLTNDTLNGTPLNSTEVTLTSTPNGPLTVNTDGSITVAPNTPAGPYTVSYQICENLNSLNCDTATVTVTVTAPVVLANDDIGTAVNGYTGGTAFTNVLGNDTLNGTVVSSAQVNATFVSATIPGISLSGTNVIVAPGTPAGTYSLDYQICEKLNPTNCDLARVSVIVTAAPIDAVNDTNTAPVYGTTGGTTDINVFANDILNGNPLNPSNVVLTAVPNGPLTINPNGSVSVAPNTVGGTYTVNYTICEVLNPTNCDTATVTVFVSSPGIALVKTGVIGGTGAVGDVITYTFTVVNTGNNSLSNIVVNDALTASVNLAVSPSTLAPNATGTATATYVIRQSDIDAGKVTNTATVTGNTPISGSVTDTSGTTITNDIPTVTTLTSNSSIALVKKGAIIGTGVVGNTITYTFTVTNTGNTTLSGVVVNDPLTASVNLAVTPSTLAPNATGIATATYVIKQLDVDAGKVTNSATVVAKDPKNNNVTDISGTTVFNNTPTITTYSLNESIALVKTSAISGTGTVVAGNAITYTFTVTNTGSTTLNGIVINDPLTGSVNLAITPSTLAPNATGTATATYVIKQSDIDAGRVTNSAIVTGTTPTNGPVTDISGTTITNNSPTVTLLNSSPDIRITKDGVYVDTNNDGKANAGDIVRYTFSIANTGNVALANITVTDNHAIMTGGALSTLAAGTSNNTTFSATYTITNADIERGYVYNSASVSATSSLNTPIVTVSTDPTPCATCPVDTSCLSCTITAIPQTPSIALIKKATFDDNNGDGHAQAGETISYTFTVMNTGNLALTNVVLTDALPGVVISGGTISLALGETNTTSFSGVYHLTQEDIINGSVSNQAMVKATNIAGIEVLDMSDDDSPMQDEPTVLSVNGCALEIFNAVSPDGDGLNDFFRIRGIECYPKNTVEIYNRWGVKVYNGEGYNNNTIAFRGVSEGRNTVSQSEGLPSGTYFYVLKYEDSDSNGITKSGYLDLKRD